MYEIFQDILKLVFVPTAIVAVLAWLIREVFKSYLSKDLERYKSGLQKDLEGFKESLKAEYAIRTAEFQTRFSLLHHKRAEMIEELFSRLARLENTLTVLNNWPERLSGTRANFCSQFQEDIDNVTHFFDEKVIYFDDETKGAVFEIVRITKFLKSGIDFEEGSPLADRLQQLAERIRMQNIRPVMMKLETKFKSILAAETPTNQFLTSNETPE